VQSSSICSGLRSLTRRRLRRSGSCPRGRRLLVDGQAAGIWKLDHGRVKLEPFERLSREARKQLDDEVEWLAEFLS
jgi:hypothetical protein